MVDEVSRMVYGNTHSIAAKQIVLDCKGIDCDSVGKTIQHAEIVLCLLNLKILDD